MPTDSHKVLYYAGHFPAEEVAEFLRNGLAEGSGGVVLATARNCRAVRAKLGLQRAEAPRVTFLDAEKVLRQILDGERIDGTLFEAVVGKAMADASLGGSRPVHAFGELVVLLCKRGLPAAAIDLERHWNRFLAQRNAYLLCAYPMEVAGDPMLRRHIDAQHCYHGFVS